MQRESLNIEQFDQRHKSPDAIDRGQKDKGSAGMAEEEVIKVNVLTVPNSH